MKNAMITALATPFINGKTDIESYAKLCDFQVKNGADALLALGTTAEAQLLTKCEKKLLIKTAKGIIGNTPLLVGVEQSATFKAIEEAKLCEEYGANGLLIAPPSFCKCTQEGFKRHIKAICDSVTIPLVIYNVPSRAGYKLEKETILSLKNDVKYLKDASGDTNLTKSVSDSIRVFCGNDELLSEYLLQGATGVISVTSNVAPKLTRKILCGEQSETFVKLAQLTMREVNPIAIKYMLYKTGLFTTYEMRLPLTSANENTRSEIDAFFDKYGEEIR